MATLAAGAQGMVPPVSRVLVVDDVPQVREIHARFLRDAAAEILLAENGWLALEVVRRAVPDVVVTDLDMPVMNGADLCRSLRADEATRHVVVIVVTGDGSDHRVAFDAGCDAVLDKPCSQSVLIATIRLLLERRARLPLCSCEQTRRQPSG